LPKTNQFYAVFEFLNLSGTGFEHLNFDIISDFGFIHIGVKTGERRIKFDTGCLILDTGYKNVNYDIRGFANFRPARNALACEAGGHFSPGPDLVIPDSTKINQDWRYIISKRIFKSCRTRAGSLLTLGI